MCRVCDDAPELVAELSIGETYENFKPVVGERLVPFMTGEDGWLALDYRQTDSVPPVVVVGREGDQPSGVIEFAAASILDAFTKFH